MNIFETVFAPRSTLSRKINTRKHLTKIKDDSKKYFKVKGPTNLKRNT